MLSIVNPEAENNGAATVTRGLLKALALPPLEATIDCVPVRAEPPRWNRLAQARGVIRSLVSSLPSKAAFFHSREFLDTVREKLRSEHYDLMILNGSDLLWVPDELPGAIPRILVAHNIEHILFRSQIDHLGRAYGPFQRFFEKDCERLEAFEMERMGRTRNVVFLSREEEAYARRHCAELRSVTVPPMFDYEARNGAPRERGPVLEIGYVGNFGWWPNQLGLRWFLSEVFPHITAPVRLHLFGHRSGGKWSDSRVVGHGVVGDLEQVWSTCDLLICPTKSTGGVSVKLAEAVYNRIPVLAHRHSSRGLPVGEDPAVMFLEEDRDWVEFLNSTAAQELAQRRVSNESAAETAAETAANFAIESHRDKLQQFVWAALEGVARSGAAIRDAGLAEAAAAAPVYCEPS